MSQENTGSVGASKGAPRASATNPEEYFQDPFSRYYVSNCFFVAGFRPDIFCLVAWGKIDVPEFEQLAAVLNASNLKLHPARRQLVCHEALSGVSTAALLRFFEFVRKHPDYQAGVIKEAVSRGPGLVGMIAEGFYRTTPLPFPGRTFQSREQALDWLAPDTALSVVLDELQMLTARFVAQEPLISQVRSAVSQHGFHADLQSVARLVGVSPRSLQRKLQSAGTRFDTELNAMRMSRARDALMHTEIALKELAAELGYSSVSAFTSAFKRSEGMTPYEWKQRHRGM